MQNQKPSRRIIFTGGLTILLLAMVGCNSPAAPTPTNIVAASPTPALTETPIPVFTATSQPSPTNTTLPPTPTTLPDEITDPKGVVMRLVPAGPFTMGSDNGMPDEKPPHLVDLPAFYMDKFEVTNALYKACVDEGACQEPANTSDGNHPGAYGTYGLPLFDKYPVIWVDWNRARTYCAWRGTRLPSEAEWEKAAHGTDKRTYPWGDSISSTFANFGNNLPETYSGAFGKTAAVGDYPKGQSPYGIYDMAGNVWEWVEDWYDVYPGGAPSVNNAFGQKTYRVLRGGAWSDDPSLLRTTFRGGNTPDTAVNYVGFRCARTP